MPSVKSSRSALLGGLALSALVLSTACASAARPPPGPAPTAPWPHPHSAIATDPVLEVRVAVIVAGMTLAQKVGQMTQPEIHSITPAEVQKYDIGSVLNGGGSWPDGNPHAHAADWLRLAEAYRTASMRTDMAVKVPLIWGTDAVHGDNNVFGATLFPHHIGLGATHDAALVEAIGEATARAVRATGIDWVFAPTLAVARDDRWGRTYESFSEDPSLVAAMGGAAVRGLQRGLGGATGVVATAKHFIGDGGTRGGQDQGVDTATEAEMVRIHAAGYAAALAAGVQTVMASFSSWNDLAAGVDYGKMHGSHYMLTEVLKQKMGFDGFVVSDWNGIGQVPGCTATSCARAINAGIDMVMVPDGWRDFIAHTIAQVRAGQIPMARIDDAVSRILRVKLRAGLFAHGPGQAEHAGDDGALQARALARRAVRESLVLLKNNGQVLPLRRDARLLVVGKAADSLQDQTGGWSLSWQGTDHSNADFPAGDTVLAGLREAGAQVVFSATGEGVDATRFDAVVAVIGETPYAEGHGDIPPSGTLLHSSRYPEDLAVLQRVAGHGVPVVTLFLSGRPLFVNDLLNRSDAFVAAWLPGTEGAGIADVLLRRADGGVDHDFSGHLSFSWPRAACQTPLNAGDGQQPLFALGYGLDYTSRATLGALDESAPAGGCDAPAELAIFNTLAVAPYALAIGSSTALWPDVDLGGDPSASRQAPAGRPVIRVATVQMHTQQDALRVTWSGPARLFAWSPQRAVLAAYADGALVFDTEVSRPPAAAVSLAMECGKPCAGALDVTRLFAQAGGPRRLKIPLACFAAAGVDLNHVDVPFSLDTTAAFEASFANIHVAAGAGRDGDAARCADLPMASFH